MGASQSSIATYYNYSVQFESLECLDDLIRDINGDFLSITNDFACIRVATIRRTEDCATTRQNPAHIFDAKRDDAIFIDEAIRAIANSKDFASIFIDRRFHRSTDDRIKTRRVSAACKYSDSFHDHLLKEAIIP